MQLQVPLNEEKIYGIGVSTVVGVVPSIFRSRHDFIRFLFFLLLNKRYNHLKSSSSSTRPVCGATAAGTTASRSRPSPCPHATRLVFFSFGDDKGFDGFKTGYLQLVIQYCYFVAKNVICLLASFISRPSPSLPTVFATLDNVIRRQSRCSIMAHPSSTE